MWVLIVLIGMNETRVPEDENSKTNAKLYDMQPPGLQDAGASYHANTLLSDPKSHIMQRCGDINNTGTSKMMISRFISFFVTAAAAAGLADAAPFVPKSKTKSLTKAYALELRGGESPIEAEIAAKVVGGIAITTGSVFTVADKFCNKSYGLDKELSPTDARQTIDHNLSILSAGLVMYSLLFREDISWNLAMALGNLPWAFRALGDLLNESYKTTGPSKIGSSLIFLFTSVAAYGGLTAANWAGSAFKASSMFALASGLPILLVPGEASKLWEVKSETEMTNGMITGVGVTLTGLGAFLAALAWGDDIITAVGKKSLVDMLSTIKVMYFSPEWASLGISKAAVYFWLILNIVAAYSILVK